ncbi:UDP-N-acetylmuramate dehydrogenase [Oligoflexus tunisiensis]|uniref:UDP-N-acetylmuramate dehydrogenase n=1 Tax=Oligoflexus tunisiensis TaxID=708132 RepID=UPI00159F0338|nr:UDP-N-acetylmuramate dehydrogenase [Oligoflexus tunisiensis]
MKLRDLAYYRTGGRCQALYEPKNIEDLSRIVQALHATRQRYFVLGGGTNSLVLDEDWPGAVIVFRRMKKIEVRGTSLYVEAGADNTAVSQAALEAKLEGVAWMNRLPGQIGGTVRMNARCYGGEISQVTREVHTVLPDGSIRVYTAADGIFRGYKDTLFMDNGAIVAAAVLQLEEGVRGSIETRMKFYEQDRMNKGQFHYPTCGCVFKNDYSVGVPSGMLLDKAGAHKLSRPEVALNPQHANFVYNKGASSRDILELTLAMRDLVYQEYGVWLEYEMEILGELPADLKARVQDKKPARFQESKLEPLRALFQKKQNPGGG